MDKKNLDELFREKFKTFREVPDEKVWTAIENSLNRKRKKRVIPLWWQLGGVAAVLVIGLVAFYTLKDSGDETPILTNTEKTNVKDTKQDELDVDLKKDEKDALLIPEVTEDAVVNSPEASDLKNTDKYPSSEVDGVSGSEKSFGNDRSKTQEDVLQISEVNKDAVANGAREDRNKNTDKYSDSEPNTDSFQDKLPNTDIADTDATSLKNKKDSGIRPPERTQLVTNESDSNRKTADRDHEPEEKNDVLKKDNTNVISEGNKGAIAIADSTTSKKADTSKTDSKKKPQDGIVAGQVNPKAISENLDKEIAQNNQIGKDDTKTDDNKKSILDVLEEQKSKMKKRKL